MRTIVGLTVLLGLMGCGRKATVQAPELNEPDRVLYERAMHEMKRSRYDTARQALSVLVAQYESSEYFPKAKYALGESFYLEGSPSALTQAEVEFRDYIILLPKTDLADDAQLKIAMTHLKQVERPDRDTSQAILADRELQVMIEDYPDSDLLEEAKKKRLAVQEVLAEAEYLIGNQYLMQKVYRAAYNRYVSAFQKYPDYSRMDDLLLGLGESLLGLSQEQPLPPTLEPDLGMYYTRIVQEFPFSPSVNKAKRRLKELSLPIPEPNPLALNRIGPKPKKRGIFGPVLRIFGGDPAVSTETGAASIRRGEDGADSGLTIEPKVVSPTPRSN